MDYNIQRQSMKKISNLSRRRNSDSTDEQHYFGEWILKELEEEMKDERVRKRYEEEAEQMLAKTKPLFEAEMEKRQKKRKRKNKTADN